MAKIHRIEIIVIAIEDNKKFKKYEAFFRNKFPELSKRAVFFNSVQKATDFTHEDSLRQLNWMKRRYEMYFVDVPKDIESLPREVKIINSYATTSYHYKIS